MRQHERMPALTRAEAEHRARVLDVRRYSIDLDLTRGAERFASTTTVRFTCTEPGAETFVEIKPAALGRAVLNGRELDTARALRGNRLRLTGLAADNVLVVEAEMPYSRTGEGMHRFTDPVDGEVYLYTQCGLDDAQRVFAAFDQPDLKAPFEIAVTVPPGWTVLSNGVGEERSAGRWEFSPTAPISTYLAAVVAGPYHSVLSEHDGIPLGLHCRRSLARHLDEDAEELFEITGRCFDRYHELFEERYPFGSYDQAFVPEFNFGAMENPGCVTFRDDFVFRSAVTDTQREERAIVIAHEMAHMWFGDLVTMRWWDDLWLNESFAEFMGQQIISEATRFTETWTGFGVRRKTWGYDADQRSTTHPVAPESVDDTAQALLNFDGISYAKGASALRQLVAWLGDEAFLAGINEYFSRHAYGNATLADLLDALGEAGGRDVHGWAERWLRTSGVDTLRVEGGGAVLRPHRIAVGLYDRNGDGGLVLRGRTDTEVEPAPGPGTAGAGAVAEAPDADAAVPVDPAGDGAGPRARPGGDGAGSGAWAGPGRAWANGADGTRLLPLPEPRPDLVLPNDLDLTYAKIRFDETSWRTVEDSLGRVGEPLSRAVVWTAARDMVRDGELPPVAYLELVARHLPDEPVVAIVEGVLEFARGQVADRCLAPRERADALAALSGVCRRILRRTEDGSDAGLRLTAVRGMIDCARGPRAVAELRDWLDGDGVPGGPALDPELRWKALLRLSVLGETGEHEIAAELDRDPSASGRQGAARCRAARPDAAAKTAAWEALFHDDGLSNYLMTATARGFWQPEQADLLAPWVPRYFPEAVAAAERRGPAVGTVLGRYAFPGHAAEPATLRAAEECLAGGGVPPALRRWLADQLDDLRRASRARHRAARPVAQTHPVTGV